MSEREERELAERLRGRAFTLDEAIAMHAGKGFFEGASIVPAARAAHMGMRQWLGQHLRSDPSGCILEVLCQELDPTRLSAHLDNPMVPLRRRLEGLLRSKGALTEFVRKVDAAFGLATGERPWFDQEGKDPHPEDEYTMASVRVALEELLAASEAG